MNWNKARYTAFFIILVWVAFVILALCSGCNKHLKLSYGAAVTGQVKINAQLDTTSAEIASKSDTMITREMERSIVQEAVAGDSAGLELTAADLQPVTDVNGNTVGRTFTARKGRTEVTVKTDNKGNARIDCKTDSLKREVEYYRREDSYKAHRIDSMQTYIMDALLYREVKTDSTVVKQEEVKTGFRGFEFLVMVVSLVGVAGIAFAVGYKLG